MKVKLKSKKSKILQIRNNIKKRNKLKIMKISFKEEQLMQIMMRKNILLIRKIKSMESKNLILVNVNLKSMTLLKIQKS